MRIEDISGKDLMTERLRSGSAAEAFAELLEMIGRRRKLEGSVLAGYLSAVVERHQKNPCGLAHGLAFPNARLRGLSLPFLAVGICDQGLQLGGKDGSLSRIILLYVGRAVAPADEREMLERLSRALTDPAFAARLVSSENSEELWESLHSIDAMSVREGGPCPTR
jgi:mannitol/fructose-specific phosphotransferase system IIA component (Ntr-type)